MKLEKTLFVLITLFAGQFVFAYEPAEIINLNDTATQKHQVFDIEFHLSFNNIKDTMPAVKELSENRWFYGVYITNGADGNFKVGVRRAIVANYDNAFEINENLYRIAKNNNGKYLKWDFVKTIDERK